MKVESFDPTVQSEQHAKVRLTDAAKAHIEAQILRAGERNIRLAIEESGCNGYKYQLEFIGEPNAEDRPMGGAGTWQLFVREQDLRLVGGTEVILQVEGLNTSLKFKNPNAQSHCGCGESFSLG